MNILPDIAQLQAMVAELQAQNEALRKAKANGRSAIKISAKGAVSVYGLGRFPVTLYGSQWAALAEKMPEVLEFIAQNKGLLSVKE